MSHTPQASSSSCESSRDGALVQPAWQRWALAALCLVPLLAVSNQSFWIDETLTALKAAETPLGGWWRLMTAEKLSDLQMPFYMLYTWGWARVFGTGEWMLRAANLPWFVGGVLAFAFSFRGPSRLFATAVATLSSFAWFYLDEARPYAMQLGASLLIVASLRGLDAAGAADESPVRWVWAFGLGVGVLAGTSLLGVFWCGAALAVLLAARKPACLAEWWKAARVAWLLLGLWLAGLVVYYAWTLLVGARASAAGTTNLQNVFFVVYELLGFSGLGPGRLEIRETGLAAFRAHLLPLAAYGGFAGVLLAIGFANLWRQDWRKVVLVGGIVLATLVCLVAAGWTLHFRLLGRHCAPMQAAVLVLLVAGAIEAERRPGWWFQGIVCGFLLVAAGSCLSARFAERHRKDDYRAAAAHARVALEGGKTVWWSADSHGAEFYGLPVSETPQRSGSAVLVLNPAAQWVAARTLPDVVVCSKPDLYDVQGALQERLTRDRFQAVARFTAFTVWARPP